jgi:Effector protein
MIYRQFENLTIEGSADYEKAVCDLLEKLWGTWTGWAVIRGVVDTRKKVKIVPLLDSEVPKESGQRRAFAMPKSNKDASARGSDLYRGGIDDPATKVDERFQLVSGRGTGKGSDCEIHYSPEDYAVLPVCSKTVTKNCVPSYFTRDRGADDTLVHELTHALREMKGQFHKLPTRHQGYDNQEEFFAMVVQNTYASERKKTVLSAGHHGGKLNPEMAASAGFFGKQRPISLLQLENRLLVDRFIRENPDLCHGFATRVTATFNPVKEMMENPYKYPYDSKLTWPLRR